MVQTLARFVWGGTRLLPGPVEFDDPRLENVAMHLEFRRGGRGGLPLGELRLLIPSWGEVQVDLDGSLHKELVDLLMLGAVRVCIDAWAPDKEIELGHALSEQILLRALIPSDGTSVRLWTSDSLIPRLRELMNTGPSSVLLVSRRRGDLDRVWRTLPDDLLQRFGWWLAPDEGKRVQLMKGESSVLGWVLDGARMLEERG